ncbi:MAG TPA: hypothetical protein VNF69_09005 [Burkholderiales bacterium]|nr:hypothetical protein [Burkholderiales bacterium]
MDAELSTRELEQLAQALRLAHVPNLGARPDRNVDQQMRRAGRRLLRKNRRDHLALRVEVERALDRYQGLVRRREVRPAAPGDAAAQLAHVAAHRVERDLDLRQHLHGVGGPGG